MQVQDQSSDTRTEEIATAISQMRIILAVLAIAVLVFAAIVLGMNASQGPMMGGNQMVPMMLAGISTALLVVGAIVGVVLVRRLDARARNLEQIPLERITGAVILSAALIEGPSMLAAVAALLGGVPYLLITMVGAALLLVQWIRLPDRMRDMAGLSARYTWP